MAVLNKMRVLWPAFSCASILLYNHRMAASPATTSTSVSVTIRALRSALANGLTQPSRIANQALANSNRNPGRNTYLWQDVEWTHSEATRVESMPKGQGCPFGDGRDALWGLPISVKDCFDLAGAPTTCGVTFYRDRNGIAGRDSWVVERLRSVGAVVTGKTHLHPLALLR